MNPARFAVPTLLLLLIGACQHDLGGPAPEAGSSADAPPTVQAPPNRALAQAHYLLGRAHEAAGETAEAVTEYQAALALDGWRSQDETPHAGLARICDTAVKPEIIVAACAAAVGGLRFSSSRLATFLTRRGEANARLGQTERALADFNAALKLDSGSAETLFARATVHRNAGNHLAALSDFNRVILLTPASPAARYTRGQLRARLGDDAGAADDFDKVLSDPEGVVAYSDAYRDRALAHCRTGRPEAAAVDWQVWLGLTPDGVSHVQDMLWARGYLRGATEDGFGPATLAALTAWTGAGCPAP